MILLFLAAQSAAPVADDRLAHCRATLANDAVAAEREALAWQQAGGGANAAQCLALALAKQQRWAAAAPAFETAAKGDAGPATWWAAAGNAWLAANEPAKAKVALDAALSGTALDGLARGEALLDRARANVAAGDAAAGRADLDQALVLAADDPLAWLLSATLARRQGDLVRAGNDIGQALARSPDDASVQLEAGNIAAGKGDAAAAKAAWTRAAVLAPQGGAGKSAQRALAQFVEPAPATPPEPK